jgi:hypothetical protein
MQWGLLIVDRDSCTPPSADSTIEAESWYKLAKSTLSEAIMISGGSVGLNGPRSVHEILAIAPGQSRPVNSTWPASDYIGCLDATRFEEHCQQYNWQLGPCFRSAQDSLDQILIKTTHKHTNQKVNLEIVRLGLSREQGASKHSFY